MPGNALGSGLEFYGALSHVKPLFLLFFFNSSKIFLKDSPFGKLNKKKAKNKAIVRYAPPQNRFIIFRKIVHFLRLPFADHITDFNKISLRLLRLIRSR